MPPALPSRLLLSGDALIANWRRMARACGAGACGAAVKADGYGLGAREVVARLAAAGARDFFVATWAEAADLADLPAGSRLSVLHGVRDADMAAALASSARPVLNSAAQVARWRAARGGACDVMVDTGMNRLGLSPEEATSGLLDDFAVDTLMSHLACADEPEHPMNQRQRAAFAELTRRVKAQRYSLANSAGTLLGPDYAFDLVRPGLALYGGHPTPGASEIRPVVAIEAAILQVRDVAPGESVGYGATWRAARPSRIAIVNLGYADGYRRALELHARGRVGDRSVPLVGRISMDLIALDVTDAAVGEDDWLEIDFDLPRLSAASGISQYELLTGLAGRFDRRWV